MNATTVEGWRISCLWNDHDRLLRKSAHSLDYYDLEADGIERAMITLGLSRSVVGPDLREVTS